MNGVKRYMHISPLCEAAPLLMANYPMATEYVLASEYDRLKHECEQLRAFNLGLESEARRLFADYMAADEEAISRGKERDALRTQIEVMRKDAERYRWLRSYAYGHFHHGMMEDLFGKNDDVIDQEVDEAMQASL